MFGGGRGPMGGGGGMIRAASRAMTRTGVANGGISDPFGSSSSSSSSTGVGHGGCAQKKKKKLGSSSSSSNLLTITAVNGSPLNLPVPATSGWNGAGAAALSFVNYGGYDDFEWVSDQGSEVGEEEDRSVFGSVPSVDEVHDAVSALKQVYDASEYSQVVRDKYECSPDNLIPVATGMVHQAPSSGSESDWMEPSDQLFHSGITQPRAFDHVRNAFGLLKTEPAVQKMVEALSSDKAVWDAVMKNDAVLEIRDLYYNCISEGGEGSSGGGTPKKNNGALDFIKWVFDNTMVKATQVLEKMSKVVTQLFNNHNSGRGRGAGNDPNFNAWLEEKLRTSVLLSIMVLLVVMVSRACNRS